MLTVECTAEETALGMQNNQDFKYTTYILGEKREARYYSREANGYKVRTLVMEENPLEILEINIQRLEGRIPQEG